MAVLPSGVPARRNKQIRIGGSRSKNGCSTCKTRRVKCDETKPECRRCSSTGRTCDGYKPKQARALSWPSPSLTHQVPAGSRAWEYFYHCCVEQVFGGSQFEWVKLLIVRLGQQEDSVNAAVLAFSAAHEATTLPSCASSSSSSGVTATTAYCAAVRFLSLAIDWRGRVAVPVALVCCILFAALEMMRRDDDEAVRHIEHGLEIVAREQGIERSGGSLCMPGWSSTAAHGVMPALVSSFYRLAIAVYFCGRPETLLQERIMTATQPRMPSGTVASFDGIDRARKDLALLVGSTLKFVAHVSKHRYCGTATAPLFRRRDERIQSLTSWHASFKLLATAATLTDAADSNSARRRLECLVLESQLLALIILLHTCLDANESGYDARTEEFRSMLLLCEEYISLSASSANTEPRRGAVDFTFDMEILPQLFLVGKKCRLRPYRRWGIALLKKYTRREGMWDPKRLYRLATRIMEIEEAQSFPGDESPPRECNRLWTVDADWRDSGSLLATFAYKPVVLGGNGLSWKETILVEPSQ